MKKRFITSIFIILSLILAFISRIFTPYIFDVIIGLLAVIGCVEVSRVFERDKKYTNIILVGMFAPLMYFCLNLGIYFERSYIYYIIYFLATLLILFLMGIVYNLVLYKYTLKEMEKRQVEDKLFTYTIKKCLNSFIIMIYPALLFVSFFVINHFQEFKFVESLNYVIPNIFIMFSLLFVFVVTMCTDTFAYLIGSKLKGPKLCPIISPNKTYSGAIGGLIFGTLFGLCLYLLFMLNQDFYNFIAIIDLQIWKIIIISIVTSIMGQFGDLFSSYLKRKSRVKDYGTIFPGHGGIMDRVDALIVNATIICICMFILI